MKKQMTVILAVLMALSLAACAPSEPAVTSEPQSQSRPEATAEPTAEPTEEPQSEPKSSTPQPAEDVVYDEEDFLSWTFFTETEDEVLRQFVQIDTVPYGTAGSSLQQASAAVTVLELTKIPDAAAVAAGYVDGMNDLQRDYFSFQWQNAAGMAAGILTEPENYLPMLSDIGQEDFAAGLYSAEELDRLNGEILGLLGEHGVRDQWKDYAEDYPYFA